MIIMAQILKLPHFHSYILVLDKTFRYAHYCIRTAVNLSYKIFDNIAEEDRPPLLILHDLLSNKRQWDSLGKTIHTVTKRIVVTVDQRNHGHSPHAGSHKYEEMAADIQQLLTKLSIENAFLLGHGIGGRTSLFTALVAPQLIAGLVVIDASPISTSTQFKDFYSKIMTSMKEMSFKGEKKLKAAKRKAKTQLEHVISDDVTMNIVLSNLTLKSDHTIGWACNLDVLLKYFENMTLFPSKLKGKKYFGPTLFVGGQLSEYLPPDDLPAIRELCPRAVITYVSKTGHNLPFDDPKSFLELIIPFLK